MVWGTTLPSRGTCGRAPTDPGSTAREAGTTLPGWLTRAPGPARGWCPRESPEVGGTSAPSPPGLRRAQAPPSVTGVSGPKWDSPPVTDSNSPGVRAAGAGDTPAFGGLRPKVRTDHGSAAWEWGTPGWGNGWSTSGGHHGPSQALVGRAGHSVLEDRASDGVSPKRAAACPGWGTAREGAGAEARAWGLAQTGSLTSGPTLLGCAWPASDRPWRGQWQRGLNPRTRPASRGRAHSASSPGPCCPPGAAFQASSAVGSRGIPSSASVSAPATASGRNSTPRASISPLRNT